MNGLRVKQIIKEEIKRALNEDPFFGPSPDDIPDQPVTEAEKPGAGRTSAEIKSDVRAAGKAHGKSSEEIKKVIDMIDGIEESGKKYNRSKEYVARTIHDKLPVWAIKKPTKMHGPEKSGPKSEK
jgi:hypothetical protein